MDRVAPSAGGRTTAALCWTAFAFGFGGSLAIQASALVAPEQGLTGLALGLGTTSQAAGIILGAPSAVRLLRAVGSRQLAVSACMASALALAVLSLCDGAGAQAVVRFLLGVSLGIGVSVTEYILTARAAGSRRSLTIALYAASFSGGTALAPAAIFICGVGALPSLIGVLALAVAALILGGSALRARIEPSDASASILAIIRNAPLATAAALVYGLLSGGFLDFMGVFALKQGYSASDASLVAFSGLLGLLLLQIPIGYLGDRVTPQRLLPGCALLAVAALGAVGSCAGTFWALCACVFVLGGLCDAFYTVGLASLSERVPGGQLAAANGCFVALCGAGETIGPAVAGATLDASGTQALVAVFAVIVLTYAAASLACAQRMPLRLAFR